MARKQYTQNSMDYADYGYDDPEEFRRDIHRDMQRGMSDFAQQAREIAEAQERGETIPDYKLFGFIPMPAVAGAALKTIINPMLGTAGTYVQEHTGTFVEKYGQKYITDAAKRSQVAKGIALTSGLATLLSDNALALKQSISDYHGELGNMARTIAPVLDEIKGRHGFSTMLAVSREDNELIYAFRRRQGAALTRSNMNNMIGVGAKVPGVLQLLGKPYFQNAHKDGSVLNVASGGLGSLAEIYQDSLRREHKRANSKPSGLIMITELAEQIKDNKELTDFEVPGSHRQVSLPDYIALTFKCHQEDMAKLDPGCSTIRKALDKPLLEVSERIADALKNNEISPLMLVRLVGERHIVKNGGRAVASVAEVDKILRKMSGKAASYNLVSEKEYFADKPANDIKDALKALKGDERLMYMATIPDNILRAVGISDKEIHSMRESTAPHYERIMTELTAGLGAKDDKELEAEGISGDSITEVRKAERDMANGGKITSHIASASHASGVEDALHDIVLEGVRSGKGASFASVLKQGKQALAERAAEGRAELDDNEGGHAKRIARARADNSEERGLNS